MSDNEPSKELGLNAVIAMNDTISGVDNFFGVGNFYRRVVLLNAIYSLSHYLCFSLNSRDSQAILFENIETFWISVKKLSNSLIASRTSCKCLRIYSLSINQMFRSVDIINKISVFETLLYN